MNDPRPTTRPADLDRLAADIQARWAGGEPPDAAAALAAHPELAAHKPLVLELAYEEFCQRAEGGAPPDPAAFVARFPFAESVARLLAIHSVVGRHPSFGPAGRPATDLRAGEQVGDLRVLRRLGRGGFSDVYLVSNAALGGRPQVLKVSTRGREEADVLGPLTHPHLMPVWDVRPMGGCQAVVSPYLGLATGETLVERAGERPTTAWLLAVVGERRAADPPVADPPPFPVTPRMPYPRAVLHIAAAVAGALSYLHGRGIAHRDLKPSNLLLGPTAFPYLLDFNLADDGRGGRIGGTVAYAAPEVLAALAADRPREVLDRLAADVFAFAVLVCELLLARHPYLVGEALARLDAGTVAAAAASARQAMAAARLPVPAGVRCLLLAALAADPAARPTAAELASRLARAVAPPARRWVWATAAAAVLALGGGAAWWAWGTDREPTEPFARGCWLVRHGHPDVAIPAFVEADKTDTGGRAAEWLAYCHAVSGAHPVSAEYADKAIAAGRETVSTFTNRAAGRMLTGKDLQAVADAQQALDRDPDCREARVIRGMARLRLSPNRGSIPREVVNDLDAGLEGNEGNGGLWVAVAEARVRVEGVNDADRQRALEAVAAAVRAGVSGKGLALSQALTSGLDPVQFRLALDTPPAAEPLPIRPLYVRPDW